MADEKDVKDARIASDPDGSIARHRIEFWCSSADAFFQEALKAMATHDRLGTIVAAARLAQLGSAIRQEYLQTVQYFVESDTEHRVAEQQAAMVCKMVNDNGEQCHAMGKGTAALAAAEPDLSSN